MYLHGILQVLQYGLYKYPADFDKDKKRLPVLATITRYECVHNGI